MEEMRSERTNPSRGIEANERTERIEDNEGTEAKEGTNGSGRISEGGGCNACGFQDFCIDSMEDISKIDFLKLCEDEVNNFDFDDLGLVYEFYNSYAKTRGFSARKSKTRRRETDGEVVQQTFVCFHEGFREAKFFHREHRRRELRAETRCGCSARIQVRKEAASRRWIMSFFFQ